MDIYNTPEEAAAQAKADAEAAGVTPQAVMYSSPDGYGVGSEDQVKVATDEESAPVESVPEPTQPREVRDESATTTKKGKKG